MVNSNQKNEKIKFCITGFFAIAYFSIMNNPKFIKRFTIKLNDEHIVYYGLIYVLLVYSTYKVIDKIMNTYNEDVLEHYNAPTAAQWRAALGAGTTAPPAVDCDSIQQKILEDFIDSDTTGFVKKYVMKEKLNFCTEDEKSKQCQNLDMDQFVPKATIPKCEYVLPEQYNLYKKRKGYEPGDPSEDPTLDTIINKNNYIMFFIGFVILLGIYAMVLIFKSIF